MRIRGSKQKFGRIIICPKCGYKWRTRQTRQHKRPYVCCSRCKRYFRSNL